MTTPDREQAASAGPALMAIGAVVICCAGPVLITALAIAGFAWRRRRADAGSE